MAYAAEAIPVDEFQERAAIQNLVVRYTIALDTLMYAGVFADDAEFTFGGNTYKAAQRSAASSRACRSNVRHNPPMRRRCITQ